jgi:predicted RNA-binding Zn ribbon-like protein
MSESNTSVATLKPLGRRSCLDFANTAEWHASDRPQERLASYSDFILWGQHAGILTKRRAQRLLQKASDRAAEAAAVLEQAITLREAIYRIFAAIAHGQRPKAADLATLNEALSEALAQ